MAALEALSNGCFNPRAREGRDLAEFGAAEVPLVSIHAPARGATLYASELHRFIYVSIHAPARGATLI